MRYYLNILVVLLLLTYRASSDYRAQWIFKTEKRATPTMGGSFSATLTATYVSAQMASYYRTGDFYGGAIDATAEL